MDDVPEGMEGFNLTLSLLLDSTLSPTTMNVTPAVATVRIHDLSSKFIGPFDIILKTIFVNSLA